MAPATKRRKTQLQRYECQTCMVSRISSQFPDSNPTSTCEHLINTCKRCLKEWVESQIETSVFTPRIACPECEQKMGREDVGVAVTKKLFARYVQLERVYTAENTPGWRWCLAPGCEHGQIHVPGKVESEDGDAESADRLEQASRDGGPFDGSWSQDVPEWVTNNLTPDNLGRVRTVAQRLRELRQQEDRQEYERQQDLPRNPAPPGPDVFTCNKCGGKACVPCDRPWHENETCESYKERTNTKARIEEEDASLAAIQKETKKCPSCSKNILKNGGCKHMYCTQCQTEFCWECLQPINLNHGGQYCGCNQNQFQGDHLQVEAPGAVAAPVAVGPGRLFWGPGPRAQLIPGAGWGADGDVIVR